MATENFIQDISEYLAHGNLSDLTLIFGEKKWQIHRVLASCHSKWFQNCITIGFEETDNRVITLHDEPEFADAIDCMVSYFYKAAYDTSRCNTSASLLHAQVAVIADKYDCKSLYQLAKTLFAESSKSPEEKDWAAIAALIYEHTTSELPEHKELRSLVIEALSSRPQVLISMEERLRSDADLGADLVMHGLRMLKAKEYYVFRCDCLYAHVGSLGCIPSCSESTYKKCPECGDRIYLDHIPTISDCCSCGGLHSTRYTGP